MRKKMYYGSMMKHLTIDIETYSSKDLVKCGVYAYAEAEDFEILLFGYAFDEEEVRVIDLMSGEEIPKEVMAALVDSSVIKTAFNANFERTCLGAYFKVYMPPEQWRCTAVLALSLGLPGSLEEVSRCLMLSQKKLSEGKELIRYFSLPAKEHSEKGQFYRNLPKGNEDKWETFKSYCARDVEVERSVRKKLDRYGIPDSEQKLWCLDQRINDRGVRVHTELISHAIDCDLKHKEAVEAEALDLIAALNPKSAPQMKKWLFDTEGVQVDSLSKENVARLIEKTENGQVKKALKLRQELSKTSVRKYEAMKRALCRDERIRGLFYFYGASRTGRWAGRLVQVQNLPQNKLKDLDLARELLRGRKYEALEIFYDSVTEVLSQLIRTVFIPSEGCRFIVADFSAIEARVIAYLADESWRMEVFRSHGKIYEASAAHMFRVPIGEITKESPLRQKGKIAELALGYGGSTGALSAMGALKLGLTEKELKELVSAWRKANPNIEKLWRDIEKAAVASVKNKNCMTTHHGIEFDAFGTNLFIKLPSGRSLCYARAELEKDPRFNNLRLTYEGVEQGSKQWGRLSTYGGKLVENIVQAIARDCLAEAMIRLEEAGYKIVMHCHDEVVLEVPYGFGSVEEVEEIMAMPIGWAKGLMLRAEAFETGYYRK